MPSLVSSSFLSRRILPEKADSFDTFVTVILTSDGTQLVNAVGYAALIEISPVQMKEGSLVLKQFGDHCWSHFSLNKSKSTKNAIQFDKFIKSLGDIEFWPKNLLRDSNDKDTADRKKVTSAIGNVKTKPKNDSKKALLA